MLSGESDNFLHPQLTLPMLHIHDRLVRPVKVERKCRYLLAEPLQGVAYDSPSCRASTSKICWQLGHCTCMRSVPWPLMRL
jgi:hypothetical protein